VDTAELKACTEPPVIVSVAYIYWRRRGYTNCCMGGNHCYVIPLKSS